MTTAIVPGCNHRSVVSSAVPRAHGPSSAHVGPVQAQHHAIPAVSGGEGEGDSSAVFVLVCERTLPCFDTSKSLKTMPLTANGLDTFNRIRTHGGHVFAAMLQVGNILMVITVLAPRRVGYYTTIMAPILQLPGFILIVAAVRIQMMRILVTTYDFWFLTMSNAIFCACFTILLGDVRIFSVVVGCLIVQVSICADAQVGNARQLLVSSVVNMGVHLVLLLAVLLHLVDASSTEVTLLQGRTMSVRDALMNTQFNMIVLFAKLVYRNWRIVRERSREGRQVRLRSVLILQTRKCVTYQCVLKLVPTMSASSGWVTPPRCRGSVSGAFPVPTRDVVQLQFVRIREVFRMRDTVVPLSRGGFMESLFMRSDDQSSRWNKRTTCLVLLYLTGLFGSFLSAILTDPMGWFNLKWPGVYVEAVALVFTSAFCSTFFAFYHRRLLRRLACTFDFVFLSSKITVACCCLCKFFGWDKRVLLVRSFWLWMHWVLTLDALTPTTANALAFRRVYLLISVECMLVMQILVAVEIFYWHPKQITDSYVLHMTIAGRCVDVHMAPFFFSRIWPIVLWSGRLLWRIMTRQSEDERHMLQGQVEFHFHWRKRLRSRVAAPASLTAIGPHSPRPQMITSKRVHPRIPRPVQ